MSTLGRASTRPGEPTPELQPEGQGRGWDFILTPYVWAVGQEGSVEIGRASGNVDASFGDILDSLDFGGMLALEFGQTGSNLRMLLDGMYMRTKEDIRGGDVESTQEVYEIDTAWRMDKRYTVDTLVGFRYTSIDSDITLPNTFIGARASWVDPVIGARGSVPLFDKLSLDLRGDIGGFGLGSNFTTKLEADLSWRAFDWLSASVGWRYMKVDYDDYQFEYRVAATGPIFALSFRF